VLVTGDVVGETLYYGRGAGREPTASAVIGDLADAARNLAGKTPRRIPAFGKLKEVPPIRPADAMRTRYYLRLSLRDAPGMFGHVANILGSHRISIASVVQKEVRSGEYVPVVMLTHQAQEGAFRAALKEIDALDEIGAPTVRYRIEDFD
jgi:homoserine dehydrogenase